MRPPNKVKVKFVETGHKSARLLEWLFMRAASRLGRLPEGKPVGKENLLLLANSLARSGHRAADPRYVAFLMGAALQVANTQLFQM